MQIGTASVLITIVCTKCMSHLKMKAALARVGKVVVCPKCGQRVPITREAMEAIHNPVSEQNGRDAVPTVLDGRTADITPPAEPAPQEQAGEPGTIAAGLPPPAAYSAAKSNDLISFACPGCGKDLTVKATAVGHKVRCNQCGLLPFVPPVADSVAAPVPMPPLSETARVSTSACTETGTIQPVMDEPREIPTAPVAAPVPVEAGLSLEARVKAAEELLDQFCRFETESLRMRIENLKQEVIARLMAPENER